jgi:hypothetical protein
VSMDKVGDTLVLGLGRWIRRCRHCPRIDFISRLQPTVFVCFFSNLVCKLGGLWTGKAPIFIMVGSFFGGWGAKNTLFYTFSYIELPKMFQISYFFWEYVPINVFHHTWHPRVMTPGRVGQKHSEIPFY